MTTDPKIIKDETEKYNKEHPEKPVKRYEIQGKKDNKTIFIERKNQNYIQNNSDISTS